MLPSLFLKEWRERRAKDRTPNPEQSQKVWYKSSFQFSLQKGAKPTLKKSKLLFHKEWIALVFEKVKRAIHSFCSCCSLKKSNRERFAIIPLYKKSTRAKEHKREFPTLIFFTALRPAVSPTNLTTLAPCSCPSSGWVSSIFGSRGIVILIIFAICFIYQLIKK